MLKGGELHLCSHWEHLNASNKLEASLSLTKFPHIQQEQFEQYQSPSGSSWKQQIEANEIISSQNNENKPKLHTLERNGRVIYILSRIQKQN